MKTLLITGGSGFIGSNFIHYVLEHYPDCRVINMDKLTYAGRLENLADIEKDPRYSFIKGDICDRNGVESLFEQCRIDGIIHFAAESHVDNSIRDADVFVTTNVMGTFVLLDVARRHWICSPGKPKKGFEQARFHHISTDEVYGSLGPSGLFTEETSYAPNSPYAASKAASDMLVRSFHQTYGLDTVITNCSNNYGPRQHAEKFIPTIIRTALAGEPIPIYGDGNNIRDWLFVEDHCRGIDVAFHRGKAGRTYNIGGNNEYDNNFIASTVCNLLDEFKPKKTGSYKDQITYVDDRPGHDRRYAIDAGRIKNELGWQACEKFESGMRKTVEWYLNDGTKH